MKINQTRLILAGAVSLGAVAILTLCHAQDSVLALLPDLMVYSITTPSSAVRSEVISVSDITTNVGTYSAGWSVSDIYICTNLNNITANDWVTNHIVAGIARGKSTTWIGSVTIPASQPLGTNYYVVVCNGNRQITESNYSNNTNSVVIVINQ